MPRPPEFEVDGKKLFSVRLERTKSLTLYILAEDREHAEVDGKEMMSSIELNAEWDEVEDDVYAQVARKEPETRDTVWTGGPDGEDRFWGELKERASSDG